MADSSTWRDSPTKFGEDRTQRSILGVVAAASADGSTGLRSVGTAQAALLLLPWRRFDALFIL